MAHRILADRSASISELKANPRRVMQEAEGPVAILNRNTPEFYCVPAEDYEVMMKRLEDFELAEIARARLADGEKPVKTSIEKLKAEYGLSS
ncbi:MAG: plasmid stabilization protein [Alphaproteobacteria bacterium HGW-Alphaproteobacteria-11]|nr:MAG: plasmid stabilization protein [Alphaproteobacteria bacterium HGW-Alphaproteobacteria-11]